MNYKNLKKFFLSLFLVFVTVFFSGCMGIQFPGQSGSKVGSSAERNDSQGIFKTTDGGKTWQQKITIQGSEAGLDKMTIGSLAIDPENSSVLYAGTLGDGLYKTENGGDLWYKVTDGNNNLSAQASIYDIDIESGNSNILYAASLNENRGVLLKSEDGGKTWTEPYISTELGKQVNRIQIDAVRKNVIYIGTEQGGLIKSDDRGNHWSEIKWFETGVADFVVDYTNPSGIVVLTHDGLFKTVDGGKDKDDSWTDLTKTTRDNLNITKAKFKEVSSLQIDNDNPLIIYMTYNNLVFVTYDGGIAWNILPTITPALTASKTTPRIRKIGITDGIIYYGAGNAIYKSDNKGISWSSFDVPILGDIKYTVGDPNDKNTIYVGSYYSNK